MDPSVLCEKVWKEQIKIYVLEIYMMLFIDRVLCSFILKLETQEVEFIRNDAVIVNVKSGE